MSPMNRILLVKGRKSGKWSFPKGHKIGSENYLACALRETMEETGIDLSGSVPMACHRLSAGEYYFYELPEELEPSVKDSHEVEEVGWFTLEEISQMNCNVDVNCFLGRVYRRQRRSKSTIPP